MIAYTYRLDTSLPMDEAETIELRSGKIKVLWCQLAFLFFEKGTSVTFKYWSGDLAARNGYSSFGIKEAKKLAKKYNLTIDFDGLSLLKVDLNPEMKDYVLHQIQKCENQLSPFFHFDVLDEEGESICTAQDFGTSILVALNISDLRILAADGFDLNFLISLPEPC
ncbi:hypothetical protein [Planomicrobium sp. CPCC 101110]|uniref:hypothetical protein n=1 Tax=Planomicrobium sp. CPCC 101110 TaxID=2599619 RepID=UPI0011B57AB0|nr:hypothetical protein [Planomicrobium sp. CPCC 101110]TWT25889.1 hypothetical protein FQV30_08830 [Planomicrobium sp. CPCC 101110]